MTRFLLKRLGLALVPPLALRLPTYPQSPAIAIPAFMPRALRSCRPTTSKLVAMPTSNLLCAALRRCSDSSREACAACSAS